MNKRAETDYWVMRVPVISTAHITEDVARELAETLPGEDFYGLLNAVTPFGGFVACDDPDYPSDMPPLPKCLRDCFNWAVDEGFEWIRFDADGDQIGELTVYEWESDR